jgi:hypothetical protein
MSLTFKRCASDDSYRASVTGFEFRVVNRDGAWLSTYRHTGQHVTASPVKYWPVDTAVASYRLKRDAVAAANDFAVSVADIAPVTRFTREDGDTHAVVYGTPYGELLAAYFTSHDDAVAYRVSVTDIGATGARIEDLTVTDAIDAGHDVTVVTFVNADGDTVTVEQPGDELTAVTTVISGYGHLVYDGVVTPFGRSRLFDARDYYTGHGMRYAVDRFGAITSRTVISDDDRERLNASGLSFVAWSALVDRALIAAYGVDSAALPDAPYWDSWDQSVQPADMATLASMYGAN